MDFHAKQCEYRKIECDKCKKIIIFNSKENHIKNSESIIENQDVQSGKVTAYILNLTRAKEHLDTVKKIYINKHNTFPHLIATSFIKLLKIIH